MEDNKTAVQQNTNINAIVVDDGSVEVPILSKRGEVIGRFWFKPTDIGIVDRYNQMASEFDKITEPLENLTINPDGTAAGGEEQEEALREATERLYGACNRLFDSEGMADAFFGAMHPFSPVGGQFYCERVLEAVRQYINAQFASEAKQISARAKKYMQGYLPRTGKHKNGKQ